MTVDGPRKRKLADRITQIVAEMLERRIKDPRLGFVTVTEARLTNDLREATVFYTVYGDERERAETAAALESATGIIRSEVGRQTGLKHTPSLTFIADALPEDAKRIEGLVDQVRQADAELARSREGAEYAGDPDPYRKPADEGDPGESVGTASLGPGGPGGSGGTAPPGRGHDADGES